MHDPIAGAIAIDAIFGSQVVERPMVAEPYKNRLHAHGQGEPVAGMPAKRIVLDADVPRFLEYFVARLLGPVNPFYGGGV